MTKLGTLSSTSLIFINTGTMVENTPGRSVFSTFAWTFNWNMTLKKEFSKISIYMERLSKLLRLDAFRSTILSNIGYDISSVKISLRRSECLHTHTYITEYTLWDATYVFSSLSVKTRQCNRLQMTAEKKQFIQRPWVLVWPTGVLTCDIPFSRSAVSQLS